MPPKYDPDLARSVKTKLASNAVVLADIVGELIVDLCPKRTALIKRIVSETKEAERIANEQFVLLMNEVTKSTTMAVTA